MMYKKFSLVALCGISLTSCYDKISPPKGSKQSNNLNGGGGSVYHWPGTNPKKPGNGGGGGNGGNVPKPNPLHADPKKPGNEMPSQNDIFYPQPSSGLGNFNGNGMMAYGNGNNQEMCRDVEEILQQQGMQDAQVDIKEDGNTGEARCMISGKYPDGRDIAIAMKVSPEGVMQIHAKDQTSNQDWVKGTIWVDPRVLDLGNYPFGNPRTTPSGRNNHFCIPSYNVPSRRALPAPSKPRQDNYLPIEGQRPKIEWSEVL